MCESPKSDEALGAALRRRSRVRPCVVDALQSKQMLDQVTGSEQMVDRQGARSMWVGNRHYGLSALANNRLGHRSVWVVGGLSALARSSFRPWLAAQLQRCYAIHGLYVRQAARVSAPAYQLRYERVLPLCVRASPLFASATNVTSGAKTPRTLLELSRGVWGERASVPSNTSQYGHSLQPTTRGHAPVNL